ncbi:hypothetical protein [Streptomyces sp. NBC_00091]|uniref:hypothetical protein n=1 Tax=Streptomyces sp. NBC_00091 TaxID=2975648 RepID=UPI0022542F4E|nr:hypothetical protein [Streptomyces sp. NBC_00091]MCX5380355.1 hypothetical protein [Streptomyces sp. NBC_00091]
MNDRHNQTNADEALGILLLAHAEGLREAVGASLHTEAGLGNLWSLRYSVAHATMEQLVDPDPERVEPAETVEPGDGQLHGAAFVGGRQVLDPNVAVRRLVKDLDGEAALTHRMTRELAGMSTSERRAFGRPRHSRILYSLRYYVDRLRALQAGFERRAELNRAEVLERLQDYQLKLEYVRREFEIEVGNHEGEAAGLVRWQARLLQVAQRAEALKRLRADIVWIFDSSDDLQGVLS